MAFECKGASKEDCLKHLEKCKYLTKTGCKAQSHCKRLTKPDCALNRCDWTVGVGCGDHVGATKLNDMPPNVLRTIASKLDRRNVGALAVATKLDTRTLPARLKHERIVKNVDVILKAYEPCKMIKSLKRIPTLKETVKKLGAKLDAQIAGDEDFKDAYEIAANFYNNRMERYFFDNKTHFEVDERGNPSENVPKDMINYVRRNTKKIIKEAQRVRENQTILRKNGWLIEKMLRNCMACFEKKPDTRQDIMCGFESYKIVNLIMKTFEDRPKTLGVAHEYRMFFAPKGGYNWTYVDDVFMKQTNPKYGIYNKKQYEDVRKIVLEYYDKNVNSENPDYHFKYSSAKKKCEEFLEYEFTTPKKRATAFVPDSISPSSSMLSVNVPRELRTPQKVVAATHITTMFKKITNIKIESETKNKISNYVNKVINMLVIDFNAKNKKTAKEFVKPLVTGRDDTADRLRKCLVRDESLPFAAPLKFPKVNGVPFDCDKIVNALLWEIMKTLEHSLGSPYEQSTVDDEIWSRVADYNVTFKRLKRYGDRSKSWKDSDSDYCSSSHSQTES